MILNNNGKVNLRYDTKANWEKYNPVLDNGEMVVEQDKEGKCYLKVGDGKNRYTNLKYIHNKTTDYSNALQSDTPENSNQATIHPLPYIHYSLIDPTHTDSVYFKELLKYICRNYPNLDQYRIFIGNACPNSQGICMIHIYSTVTSGLVDGLPYYCSGVYFGLNNVFSTFGTTKGVYYYKNR